MCGCVCDFVACLDAPVAMHARAPSCVIDSIDDRVLEAPGHDVSTNGNTLIVVDSFSAL